MKTDLVPMYIYFIILTIITIIKYNIMYIGPI